MSLPPPPATTVAGGSTSPYIAAIESGYSLSNLSELHKVWLQLKPLIEFISTNNLLDYDTKRDLRKAYNTTFYQLFPDDNTTRSQTIYNSSICRLSELLDLICKQNQAQPEMLLEIQKIFVTFLQLNQPSNDENQVPSSSVVYPNASGVRTTSEGIPGVRSNASERSSFIGEPECNANMPKNNPPGDNVKLTQNAQQKCRGDATNNILSTPIGNSVNGALEQHPLVQPAVELSLAKQVMQHSESDGGNTSHTSAPNTQVHDSSDCSPIAIRDAHTAGVHSAMKQTQQTEANKESNGQSQSLFGPHSPRSNINVPFNSNVPQTLFQQQPRSWRNCFDPSPAGDPELSSFELETNGESFVIPSCALEESKKLYKNYLMGCFVDTKLPFQSVERAVNDLWKPRGIGPNL